MAGDPLQLTPSTLSTLPGVPRHIGGTSGDREGVVQPSQGGAGRPCDSKFREFLRGCIALNINYLFSPLGYAVQRQYIGDIVIVLKVKNITI